MKNKSLKISIFLLLLSFFACSCFYISNNTINTYATSNTTQDCFTLVGPSEELYTSNVSVGTIDGLGKFVVGYEGATLTVEAKDNYQLVGWQITYTEQDNTIQYIDNTNLVDAATVGVKEKEIELTSIDGEKISAKVDFSYGLGYAKSGHFTLSYIFENIVVTPVFDHIYYNIDVTELFEISSLENSITIGTNTLYFEQSSTHSTDITNYTKAVLKINEKYYYYGTLYEKAGKYYTIHKTQNSAQLPEEIDYLHGAFRVNEVVEVEMPVNIDTTDIYASTNIDMVGASVLSNSTKNLSLSDGTLTEDYYIISKDSFLRTTEYAVSFIVTTNTTNEPYVNVVDLIYHNLYVVDLFVTVDGSNTHSEFNDICGNMLEFSTYLTGNISVYNYHSRIDNEQLKFLAKKEADNNSKAFMVTCAETISKIIDGTNYKYYNHNTIAGLSGSSKAFSNFSENTTITIDYLSELYEINFRFVEYEEVAGGGYTIYETAGNTLSPAYLKRGAELTLDADAVTNVKNIGFEFVGFATSLSSAVTPTYTCSMNFEKPANQTLLLCYKKAEYTIELANYNQVTIGGSYAINSVSFNITKNANLITETLTSANLLTSATSELTTKLKLNDAIQISTRINKGFNILGYSLIDPTNVTADDYINGFSIDKDLIEAYGASGKITIYVYEDLITFDLTYVIEPTWDPEQNKNVIMAEIDVDAGTHDVKKYDINGKEISLSNNNLTELVAKIVVSDLYLNEVVVLYSTRITVGSGANAYAYMFNWFTEDNKSTLEASNPDQQGETYQHTETISKTRQIKVVYAMPSTRLLVSVDEEFANNKEFSFGYRVEQNGQIISAEASNSNLYIIEAGIDTKITIDNLAFGYVFDGYEFAGTNITVDVSGLSFTCRLAVGANNIVLKFSRLEYRFLFNQFGADLNGNKVDFGGFDYYVLDIDNRTVDITKPIGYYVSSVKFKNDDEKYSTVLSETNDYRLNYDISTYNFNLTREQFTDLATNYAVDEGFGIITVDVKLEYTIFNYVVKLEYVLTNEKGDSRDSYVEFPPVDFKYVLDGQTYYADKKYDESKIIFSNIPYGVNSTLEAATNAPNGISISGWAHSNGNTILQSEYVHSSSMLLLGNLANDMELLYKFSYIAYQLNINYISDQGSPIVKVNNIESQTKQITLYDKLEIKSNALRSNGYKFKGMNYNKPIYTAYEYSAETWAQVYANLLIKNGFVYELNSSNIYDENISYFIYSEETINLTDPDFTDDTFDVSNYALVNNTITFNIEYELVQLSIKNTIKTKSGNNKDKTWSLTGRGDGSAKVKFELQDMATFIITAQAIDGSTRTIDIGDTVNFYDIVTVVVAINTSAINEIDGKPYNLALGLTLTNVNIQGAKPGFSSVGFGEYSFSFSVDNYMPSNEEILINYELTINPKKVEVKTVVTESDTFYNNITMSINAKDFAFDTTVKRSNGVKVLAHNLQFMATATMNAEFITEEYKKNFKIAGVRIISGGVEIGPSQYADYNIQISEGWLVTAKLLNDLEIIYKVEPLITFSTVNGVPDFSKEFKCNDKGEGVAQTLTIGTSGTDIVMDSILIGCVTVKYENINKPGYYTDEVINCGRYNVIMTFTNNSSYDWLSDIKIDNNIYLSITKKGISLTCVDNVPKVTKVYDNTSNWDAEKLYEYFKFIDGQNLGIYYKDLLNSSNTNLKLANCSAYIRYNDKEISEANENVFYHLYVYNFALKDSSFNNNFELKNDFLLIKNVVKIQKRQITLNNINVYNKVFDGTDNAELISVENITIANKIAGDDLVLDISRLSVKFTDVNVGADKTVKVNASSAIIGQDVINYNIDQIIVQGLTIYPYSISAHISGVGDIELLNKRGLTDKNLVSLLPLNATLHVLPIYADSHQYASIYKNISKHLKGNNEYAIGYTLDLIVNGESAKIDNNLYLSVPNIKNLTGSFYLTGTETGAVESIKEGGYLVIDLNNVFNDVNTIFLTQKKILLKAWQIVLITIFILLIIIAVILVFIIIRKRKAEKYSVNETI